MEEARIVAFRTLRPSCVELSQVALKHRTKKASGQEVIKALETVYFTLEQVVKEENTLDPKLADYVFFPLSHIFRAIRDLPTRAVEVALQCLRILIWKGWKSLISAEMGKQLLILLSFLAGGSPQEAKVENVHEEIAVAAFECLGNLFSASGAAGLGDRDGFITTENVPLLGHAVTVMLDGVVDGTYEVRMQALNALKRMIQGVKDREALRNVFPGLVSGITKILSSKSSDRPSFKTLVNGIDVLKAVLMKAIADDQENEPKTEAPTAVDGASAVKTADRWVEATAGQVRMALANIMPLRYHEKEKVRAALLELCIAIIKHCRITLDKTIPMMVETLVILCTLSPSRFDASISNVGALFTEDITLSEMLKTILHDWIVAMPRIMQTNDDTRKERIIDQIRMAFQFSSCKA